MIAPEIIQALIDAGGTPEMVVAVLKADRDLIQARREAYNSRKAASMRTLRATRKAASVTHVTHVTDVTHHTGNTPQKQEVKTGEVLLFPLTPSSLSEEVREKNESKQESQSKRKRGSGGKTILPDDFKPAPEHYELGRSLQRQPPWVDQQCAKMRDWSKAEGARKVDWSATLRNWLRRAVEREASNRPAQRRGPIL